MGFVYMEDQLKYSIGLVGLAIFNLKCNSFYTKTLMWNIDTYHFYEEDDAETSFKRSGMEKPMSP